MKQADFLANLDVQNFVGWLSKNGPCLPVHLKVKKSRFVPVAINKKFVGIENTVAFYSWKSTGMTVGNWAECCAVLSGYSTKLTTALAAGNDPATLGVCKDILAWGGNRNWKRGAWPFLSSIHGVSSYVNNCKLALDLSSAETKKLAPPVRHMNSMLTKVHSLASNDGLPIYDSRVAAAIAVLVELWRISEGLDTKPLPETLTFPSVYGGRSVLEVFSGAISPGVLTGIPGQADQWASAKVRLGWLMQELLMKNPGWFMEWIPKGLLPATNRMHAFEAALFMLGYDVTCLSSKGAAAGPAGSGGPTMTRTSSSPVGKPTKRTTPLSGSGSPILYSGSAIKGFEVSWGDSNFKIRPGLLESIFVEFSGQERVPLGASRTDPAEGSFGYWLDLETSANSGMASAIAAVLVNEGYASKISGTKGKTIYLKFN